MQRILNFLLIKKGPDPSKMAPRLMFVGVMEIFLAIVLGGYHVFKQDLGLTTAIVPGLLFLIGIVTAYAGSFIEQHTLMRRQTEINHND